MAKHVRLRSEASQRGHGYGGRRERNCPILHNFGATGRTLRAQCDKLIPGNQARPASHAIFSWEATEIKPFPGQSSCGSQTRLKYSQVRFSNRCCTSTCECDIRENKAREKRLASVKSTCLRHLIPVSVYQAYWKHDNSLPTEELRQLMGENSTSLQFLCWSFVGSAYN